MLQHNLTLPANAAQWRVPLEQTFGEISGITDGTVELLCLDGIVGFFLRRDGQVLHGHLQHFVQQKDKKERKPSATAKAGMSAARRAKEEVLAELKQLLGI